MRWSGTEFLVVVLAFEDTRRLARAVTALGGDEPVFLTRRAGADMQDFLVEVVERAPSRVTM
jgi:hypothetical protein